MIDWKQVDRNAQDWIREAGERIRRALSQDFDIFTKSNKNDLVTNIDRETERFFVNKIRQTYPGHQIVGEEGFGDDPAELGGVIWVVDPIDGTMNFVHQKRNFAISVAVFENGAGRLAYIYDVVRDELYHAVKGEGAHFNHRPLPKLTERPVEEAILGINPTWLVKDSPDVKECIIPMVKKMRGTRSIGSAAIEIGYVAAGWLDAYISLKLSPWDFAAGMIIVEELGGKATKLTGEPLSILEKSSVFLAKPGLHEKLLETFLATYQGI